VKSKLYSVKRFELSIEFGIVWYINIHICVKIVRKKFGQFGQNLAKSGQTLEKDSQPSGFTFLLKQT
jgi:hypothetical protein